MGLSQATKNYWVAELTAQLGTKIISVLDANGVPKLLSQLLEEAKNIYLTDLDVVDFVLEEEALSKKIERLGEEMEKTEEQRKITRKHIAAAIQHVSYEKASIGWRGDAWLDGLERQAKEEIYPRLLNEHPVGREVSVLLEEKKVIERRIMLATSPVVLRTFLLRFFNEHDIDCGEDLI